MTPLSKQQRQHPKPSEESLSGDADIELDIRAGHERGGFKPSDFMVSVFKRKQRSPSAAMKCAVGSSWNRELHLGLPPVPVQITAVEDDSRARTGRDGRRHGHDGRFDEFHPTGNRGNLSKSREKKSSTWNQHRLTYLMSCRGDCLDRDNSSEGNME
ncbi:hypothetical protein R3P38DRAFT_2800533 [Favolaschia claudopus]|uniref:Uncharacterized protein n=1 Tax=Favolaschia claudopus TaxID=2862362 RepID=A0AAV9ZWY2_9AGAR